MRNVARVLGRALGSALLLLPLVGALIQVLPLGTTDRIDTFLAFFRDRARPRRAVANSLDLLARGAPAKVVVLGSSNAMTGLRAPELEARLGGYEVHNLSVLGFVLEELDLLVPLLVDVVPTPRRRESVVVLALHYDQFETSRQRFDIDESRFALALRSSGYYAWDGARYRPRFDAATWPWARLVIQPVMLGPFLRRLGEHSLLTATLRRLVTGNVVELRPRGHDDAMIAEIDARLALGGLTLPERDFRRLVTQVRALAAAGFRVVVLDTPRPPWLAGRSPYLADYQARLPAVFEELAAIPGVAVVDLGDVAEPGMFWDAAHVREELSWKWSAALAARWPFPR